MSIFCTLSCSIYYKTSNTPVGASSMYCRTISDSGHSVHIILYLTLYRSTRICKHIFVMHNKSICLFVWLQPESMSKNSVNKKHSHTAWYDHMFSLGIPHLALEQDSATNCGRLERQRGGPNSFVKFKKCKVLYLRQDILRFQLHMIRVGW